ncbi:MAG: hypothetical protein V8T12_04190 [Parabacteroides johnsonii]
MKANYYQCFEVTLPYFDVLRIKDREGHQLRPVVEKNVALWLFLLILKRSCLKGNLVSVAV